MKRSYKIHVATLGEVAGAPAFITKNAFEVIEISQKRLNEWAEEGHRLIRAEADSCGNMWFVMEKCEEEKEAKAPPPPTRIPSSGQEE